MIAFCLHRQRWRNMDPATHAEQLRVIMLILTTIAAAGSWAGRHDLLHTDDAGDTWTRQTSGTTATLYHVDFRNEKRGLAVGAKGTILRTADGGLTWSPVTNNLASTLWSVEFVNEEEGWAVGRGGIILRTGDGGLTWVKQESSVTQNLYALQFQKKIGWRRRRR